MWPSPMLRSLTKKRTVRAQCRFGAIGESVPIALHQLTGDLVGPMASAEEGKYAILVMTRILITDEIGSCHL